MAPHQGDEGHHHEDGKGHDHDHDHEHEQGASAASTSGNNGSNGDDKKPQAVAILTSGGDSQGMNAAVRAAVRMCLYNKARVFAIYWGYQGLVDGGDNIKEFDWDSVNGIIHKGGTVIGSARCQDFRCRDGRRKAAFNLVQRGITNLIVIGGDGSLTGADTFRHEWKSLLDELHTSGDITAESVEKYAYLKLVGMVGSIDNDFCGTDMTIGCDSALHRILESADCITTTAASHQRAFVLEVMGRNCGYLALVAGLSCCADWICIPEWPMDENWQDVMCNKLQKHRASGALTCTVIVAEGAMDVNGKAVTSNEIKDLLSKRLGFDTRVTVLGHVQRGGTPSAFDRLLASRFGAEAALSVLEADQESDAYVMCLIGSQVVKKPLHECVALCNAIKDAYAENKVEKVIELRGRGFESSLDLYKSLKKYTPKVASTGYSIGLINVGAPAGGMNSTNASFIKSALAEGYDIVGFEDGFTGLLKNRHRHMKWKDIHGWNALGGSALGSSRDLPSLNMELVRERFKEHKISALLVVGGFEGYEAMLQLYEARGKYQEFCIPMIMVAATLSNNVPGSWISLGCDTTLNAIVESCDRLRQSASSSVNRVFVVETMGGKCGYLATMAGIAGAADSAYIFEEKTTLGDLKENIDHLKHKLQYASSGRGLVLRAEKFNHNYTTEFLSRLYQEEGLGLFETRTCVLGHTQQGGTPSPFDRLCGTRYGIRAFKFLKDKMEEHKDPNGVVKAIPYDTACVLGMIRNGSQLTPVSHLKEHTDFKNRVPTECWWFFIRPLLKVLANYQVSYHREEELACCEH